ncbi:MAG: 50S ribosomal protein L5 [Firmicutes bacterium]|nr:50S ribosomal protein L5 [Bacillota bacterium]
MTLRLKEKYQKEVVPHLMKHFHYKNTLQVPRFEKVVVNMGVGEAIQNPKDLDKAVEQLSLISGQHPIVTKAKKSVSAFKIREGMKIGCMVTLRGSRMYAFLDKFFHIVLPRIRDFRGTNPKSFDGKGNYSIGLKEQLIFPEIEYDKVDKTLGMDVTIVTSAKTDEEARELLRSMGLPFRQN